MYNYINTRRIGHNFITRLRAIPFDHPDNTPRLFTLIPVHLQLCPIQLLYPVCSPTLNMASSTFPDITSPILQLASTPNGTSVYCNCFHIYLHVLIPRGIPDLLDFLRGRLNHGVVRGDDWDQPAREPTFLKELGLDAGGAARRTIEAEGVKVIDYASLFRLHHQISGKIVGVGIEAELGVTIPFYGYKKLVRIGGDLIDGVEAGFDVFSVTSGSIRVYLL